jgi:hypothetical protein
MTTKKISDKLHGNPMNFNSFENYMQSVPVKATSKKRMQHPKKIRKKLLPHPLRMKMSLNPRMLKQTLNGTKKR